MSWIRELPKRSWLEAFCIKTLRAGPVPKHVAFIMDGNRRFAQKLSMERTEGHVKGFDKLAETLQWCLDLGIYEVTVYAFSIENFKRPRGEVEGLMELVRQKFERLLQEKEKIMENGVQIRILGDLSLLPHDIQKLMAEAVTMSSNNTKAFLNVCFAYTSREEITSAVREIAIGTEQGIIKPSDVTEELVEKCLYTNASPEPELLVRTSGEIRLSDFLLWQTSYSLLSFIQVLWPEFSIWHLLGAVLYYQRHHQFIQHMRKKNLERQENLLHQEYVKLAIESLQTKGISQTDDNALSEEMNRVKKEREERTTKFLQSVKQKRLKYLKSLLSCENTDVTEMEKKII